MPAETPPVAPPGEPPVPVADLPPVPPPRGETPSRMGTPERVALVLAALVSAGILATLVRACLAS